MQDQIDTFGQGVYKEGSMVVPGGITLNKDVSCILIQNSYLNLDVENYRTALDGTIIKGSTSGVRARILFSISAATSTRSNITFYLNYLQKADDNETSTFSAGETFTCESDITYASTTIAAGTPVAQLLNSAATSIGSTASVGAGVFFTRGYFVNVSEQTIILDQYDTNPSYKVGLKVEERIVTADEDATLYDNAIGSTNFSAPGADRFKITLTLVKKLLTSPNAADFIELLRTNTGEVEKKVERSDLGFINDILATRTKEESGNYYVKKFKIDAKENLDDGFNGGVYASSDTTSGGVSPTEDKLSLQLSSGCAYVQGYRTERLSTSYKDVEKPRTFATEMNKTVTSDFGNFILMTNMVEAPALYSTISLKESAGGDTVGVTRAINVAFESGSVAAGATDSVYRVNVIDTQFYTKITTTGNVNANQGDYVVGATSGATGYIATAVSNSSTTYLYATNGTFVAGEVLKDNNSSGSTYATIASGGVRTYGFGDIKQYTFNSNGTADALLDVKVALPGSGPIMSSAGGGVSGTITSTLSNFRSQLRVGDVVEFSNNGASHKATVTAVTDNFNFNVTRLGSTTIANGVINGNIIRTRPELKEGTKKELLTPLGYAAVKNTNNNNTINPSGRFRTSVAVTGISSTSVSVTAGSGLQWVNATDNDSFIVIVTSGTGDGQIMSNGNGFTTSSVNASSASLTFNSAPSSIIAIGTVTSADRSGKAKTTERMKVLEINDSLGSSNGLNQVGNGFGTRVEDNSISLGCADVFKIKAIFESKDSSSPQIPYLQYTNLIGTLGVDEVITGTSSGSRARIVSTTGNRIYFIPVEDDVFTDGEDMSSPNATFKIVSGGIVSGSTDITDNYDLDDGQRDQFYDYSRINRKAGVAAPTHKVLVIFDRFFTSNGTNPYTVDSYDASDYKIIPSYEGTQLRDVIDFRPIVPQQITGSGTQSSPFTLTATKYFDFKNRAFTSNEVGLPGISDTTTLSVQYYLPRIDKLFLSKESVFQVVKGAPNTRPQAPEDVEDAMLLATVSYSPYIFDVDEDVTIEETNYRRYTFRDIQQLEDRIKTLEYYTQLSLLESDTANMEIRDSSGLSRFKNGFIVDNFASLSTADTLHPDYRVSTDFERGQMRPAHYTTQVPLQYSTNSVNVQQTDEIITLPYASTVLIDQPYASAVENVNPFNVFTYTGDIELFPESDNWVDTKSLNPIKGPVVEGNFLTTVREYNADQNGFSPIHWNSWKTTWTGTDIDKKVGKWRDPGGKGRRKQRRTIKTTTTTTTKQSRTGVRYRVTPVIEQESLGSKVVSVEHIQFMRSRNIEFVCQKLKPRTKFFAFFDGIAIPKKLITPKVIGVIKDPSTDSKTNNIPFQIGETVIVKKGNKKIRFSARIAAPNENMQINPIDGTDISTTTDYTSNLTFINIDTKSLADQVKGSYYGSPKINDYLVGETSGAVAKVSNKDLITDKKGNLRGSFFIDAPNVAGNQKFKTGTKLFRLSDDSTDSKVVGVSDSSGEAEFTSSGILQTTQETIISVRNAKITSEAQYDARTLVNVTETKSEETRWVDPLAQTFLVEDSTLEGGVFLTKIDIFFFTKDEEIPVALDIRTVVNGNPTQTVLPFSKVVKQAEDVFISGDASKPTTFTFKAPVFIPYRTEHAMVLTSDSNQYKVFISLLGNDAIDAAHIGEKISEQPYIGVLFKSQNASTWTPSQYEDLMFKIYRAEFTLPTTAAPSKLLLDNGELGASNGGTLNLGTNSLKTTAGSDLIRVFHSNHGMQSTLNYLQLSGVISEVGNSQLVSALGATDTSTEIAENNGFHTTIGGSAASSSNPGFIRILGAAEDGSEDEIIAYSGLSGTNNKIVNFITNGRNHTGTSGSATGKAHAAGAIVECYNFDGIPLTKINKTHSSGVQSINSPHSYNLQISGVNAGSGIQGGGGTIVASQNIPWDVLTPQIQSQLEPRTGMVARVQGTSATSCGPFPAGTSAETSFIKDSDFQDVTIGEENYFPATKLVANQLNEINRMNSVKSLTLELNLESEVSHLSPVIDLTRCDMITTANIINNIEPTEGIGGECAGNYITKVARLEKSATGLKVMLAANTWTDSKIVVMFKLIPVGYVDSLDELPFQMFNTTGRPDNGELIPQNDLVTFTDYEYTIEDVDEFDGFQIKISLLNHNQPYIPRVKDLRGIALA
ncbi:hypothetical protein CPMG_00033 [Prochlorococcus phage MED4-213]|uniref:DUF4815 domain-containing protein n=1 Tax=Prochlorococcus phage MED4-213 TaxID=889956 RepID=M4QD53_9CAUD|nr:hypothetical protein CPMG_00033 [Prochlorococcus phage MED4-213]AGH26134.1 hypothetical protein CPMG_00033 [Prochlorococcus phage MED4-213]